MEVYVEEFWGSTLRLEPRAPAPFDPTRSAGVIVQGVLVGHFGEIGAEARKVWDLPDDLPILAAEFDLDADLPVDEGETVYAAVPRYPSVLRDLAFVVSQGVSHADVESAVREAGGEFLVRVGLFDVYEGAPLGEGERSLAYSLAFRSPERSLQSDEIDRAVDAIVEHLAGKYAARIR